MPFYEYRCEACNKEFVLLQSLTAKPEETACPYCKEKKAKKITPTFSSSSEGSSCGFGGGFSWGGGG